MANITLAKQEYKQIIFSCYTGKNEKFPVVITGTDEYVVRSSLVVLMRYFLIDDYIDEVIDFARNTHSNYYYTNMALAWLIAEILGKYFNKGVELLMSNNLSQFVVNKAIQKAMESIRITAEQKEYLKTIKTQLYIE